MKKIFTLLLFAISAHLAVAQEANGNTIEVVINDISSDEGQIRVGLYSSADTWLEDIDRGLNGEINNGSSTVTFNNVPDGTYAISSYHDENNNSELDTNMLGIPKEDVGSSNNAPARFGPPKWKAAKFEVKGKSIQLSIDY
ncbi:DUF2141 domain-containing protein [Aurantibacter sp.]|uniref:DUF2141 domain-containing protein n=1 Tax=Aurantibacter sp. TaxID=2807103 RepID=UPI003266BCE6